MSNFSYCPLVWHLCSVKNTTKVEKIRERGLRIVWNDYQSDYKTLLEISGRELVYISRLKTLACFVYKCLNNTGPGLTNDLFNKKEIKYDLRDSNRVEQPSGCSTLLLSQWPAMDWILLLIKEHPYGTLCHTISRIVSILSLSKAWFSLWMILYVIVVSVYFVNFHRTQSCRHNLIMCINVFSYHWHEGLTIYVPRTAHNPHPHPHQYHLHLLHLPQWVQARPTWRWTSPRLCYLECWRWRGWSLRWTVVCCVLATCFLYVGPLFEN